MSEKLSGRIMMVAGVFIFIISLFTQERNNMFMYMGLGVVFFAAGAAISQGGKKKDHTKTKSN